MYSDKVRKFVRAFSGFPLSRRFSLENPEGMESFGLVVVGSDEVWNLWHPWYGGCPLFYGTGLRAERLVSYAASFGNYPASAELGPPWADRLRSFEHISVRDENSRQLVDAALGFTPEIVLDPCLLYPPAGGELQCDLERPYIGVYGHNFTPWFRRETRRFAEAAGFPLVSIGYRNDWADEQRIDAGPEDFAQFMACARGIVTNFFHGCVFALTNARPFVCELSPYRHNKIRDLMRSIGGENHLVSEETPSAGYDTLLNQPLEPNILQQIECLRRQSQTYLARAISDHTANKG